MAAAGTDGRLACRPCDFERAAQTQSHPAVWSALLAAAGTGAWHGQPEWPPPQGTGVHPHQPAEQAPHLNTPSPLRDALDCAASNCERRSGLCCAKPEAWLACHRALCAGVPGSVDWCRGGQTLTRSSGAGNTHAGSMLLHVYSQQQGTGTR